ncbi:glucosamine inositolphosphorylceramide transferase family protein [Shimia aestuarii]|nr:hypothetical protein [Shimia aestuarii]
MQRSNDAIFVTGADATYARTLYQLLRAVARKGWNRGMTWIAYDLGMRAEQREMLETQFDWVTFRTLDLAALPGHYVPAEGSYAWKPQIMWEVVEAADGPVIWMDSANLPHRAPDGMLAHIRAHGLYLLRGQAPLQERCDPKVLEALNVPRWTWGTRECVSGLVGVDAGNPEMREIMQRWCALAEQPEIMRPKESIERHMHDQAVLNALVADRVCKGEIVLPEEDVDISSGRPVRFLSTRNKVKPDAPLWQDPWIRARYRISKIVDQFLHRLDAFHLDHDPFWRMWGEKFVVMTRDGAGAPEELPCPFGHYYADPFPIEDNGETWVFVEDLNYWKDRATLAAIPLHGNRKAVPILDPGVHASFPFLFRYDGRLWMLPETCKNGRLDLYECTSFPDGWRLHRSILTGVNAADSVIFEHGGRWWLITSMESPFSGGAYRALAIFHTDDPIDGDWKAHPVNAKGREITARHGTGRNAGAVFEWQGKLIRPVQSSREYYGQGMELRAMTLTPEHFEEEVIETPPHLEMTRGEGVHHMAQLGTRIVWDRRTRH